MVQPIDIAVEAHKICEEFLIPEGISPAHSIEIHASSTAYYARKVNAANLDVTAEEVVAAIIMAVNWDGFSKWPGHPPAEKVVEILGMGLF